MSPYPPTGKALPAFSSSLLTVEEVAEALHLHAKTIRRFIQEGRLRAGKLGGQWRISTDDLAVFARGYASSATSDAAESTPTPGPGTVPVSGPGPSPSVRSRPAIEVSAVVDVAVSSREEADRISSQVLAALGSRPSGGGSVRCQVLLGETPLTLRFMVWGDGVTVQALLALLAQRVSG